MEPSSIEHPQGDIFADAIKRLDKAARIVDIDAEAIERLKNPKAMLEVSVPVRKSINSSPAQRPEYKRIHAPHST